MRNEQSREPTGHAVLCAWCGAVIRHNSVKESHGMCLKCFARMLSEHNRRGYEAHVLRKASRH